MDPITRMVAAGAAGVSGSSATYVDDVFSTFLYDGTGSAQTITNGIDLAGEGGLVWIKNRDTSAYNHCLFDTERGATKLLISNSSAYQFTTTNSLTGFNSDGFNLGSYGDVNANTLDICSWTFRKTPGFLDIQTWAGDATSGRNISHNLGSVPGMILIKKIDAYENWAVYHRSIGAGKFLSLNTTDDEEASTDIFGNTAPTSTVFTVGNHGRTNQNGNTYIAYIFAHDDQSFGTDSDEAIIKCGSFTCDSNGLATIDLGFEPQFLITKRADSTSQWDIVDSMRGLTTNKAGVGNIDNALLRANLANAELKFPQFGLTSTGFLTGANIGPNANYIYIAIRRPNKPPTAGTDVFQTLNYNGNSSTVKRPTNILVDAFFTQRTNAGTPYAIDRMRGGSQYLSINGTGLEGSAANAVIEFGNNYIEVGTLSAVNSSAYNYALSMFKRAPGFFDVVAYTGTGSLSGVNHNLGVTPELKITKCRNNTSDWVVGGSAVAGENGYIYLHSNAALVSSTNYWDGGDDSATQFGVRNTNMGSDYSGKTYVAYLFASLDGISKVGSYTGTGNDINVDCGFTAGARFVLIKRTDSTGDWYVWDTLRGIGTGNDPYKLLNSLAAQVTNTDYVDPLNAGFTVTSSAPAALNASGGTYLFLAIA